MYAEVVKCRLHGLRAITVFPSGQLNSLFGPADDFRNLSKHLLSKLTIRNRIPNEANILKIDESNSSVMHQCNTTNFHRFKIYELFTLQNAKTCIEEVTLTIPLLNYK